MAENFSADYKQGYLNGYKKAFEYLAALMKLYSDDPDKAQEVCRAFWTNELSEWLQNDGDLPALAIPTEPSAVVTTTVDPLARPSDPYEDKTA
jgi:hypothetical protein